MNFSLKPSLEHIALVKIVVALWNQKDVRALIKEYSSPESLSDEEEEFKKMEKKVSAKIRKLSLPDLLNKKLVGCIKPIGLEILKWIDHHVKYNDFGLQLPSEFLFTSYGTVDEQKTAKLLIKDETLSIEARYKLACMYCLTDYILELWNKLSDDSKHNFYNPEGPEHINEHLFVKYFSYALNGELLKLDHMIEKKYHEGLYVCMFKQATSDANIVATEYFFSKLTRASRDRYLVNIAKDVSGSYSVEVLFFLLSQMNQEQQVSVLDNKPYEMLQCILDWPFQSHFMDTIKFMDNYLPHSFFENTLQKIINKIMDGFEDCRYQNFFSELWLLLPAANRRYIVNQCFSGTLLSNLNHCFSGGLLGNLFEIKDKQNIKLIFEDATPKFKKEIIFKNEGLIICETLIDEGDLDLLELFIESCITTKDEILKFKEYFEDRYFDYNCNWHNFFSFIDKLICRYDKRKPEEEINCSPVKKLCK